MAWGWTARPATPGYGAPQPGVGRRDGLDQGAERQGEEGGGRGVGDQQQVGGGPHRGSLGALVREGEGGGGHAPSNKSGVDPQSPRGGEHQKKIGAKKVPKMRFKVIFIRQIDKNNDKKTWIFRRKAPPGGIFGFMGVPPTSPCPEGGPPDPPGGGCLDPSTKTNLD